MYAWYVAKIRVGKQLWALTNLERWGIKTFSPEILRPDRRKPRVEPLFPGYLFCRFDPESPVAPIARWSPGLAYFLGTSEGPTRLPDDLIAYLHERVAWWNNDGYQRPFRPGDQVVVQQGPLAGLEGVFQRYLPARRRCEVLVDIVGRMARAEVPQTYLRNTEPHRLWNHEFSDGA